MIADPLGILTCPYSISEELLFQASAKIDCLALIVYNRTFDAGRYFVCRYDADQVCPHCLRADPVHGRRKCDRHLGYSRRYSVVLRQWLNIDKGVRIDIDEDGDLIIRSNREIVDRIELADPRTTVEGIADRIWGILEGFNPRFGPYPIDT